MVTLAFLRINGVRLSQEANIAILESFSVLGLKNHWKSIVTSWRIEDLGLGVAPVNNFLRYWDLRHQNTSDCVRRLELCSHKSLNVDRLLPDQHGSLVLILLKLQSIKMRYWARVVDLPLPTRRTWVWSTQHIIILFSIHRLPLLNLAIKWQRQRSIPS